MMTLERNSLYSLDCSIVQWLCKRDWLSQLALEVSAHILQALFHESIFALLDVLILFTE